MSLRGYAFRAKTRQVPETLSEWLQKWKPKIGSIRKKRLSERSATADNASDELDFLLARTVENQVPEK